MSNLLPTFLKSLFGGNDPASLARSRLERWREWVAPIPGDNPVGIDPAYEDDFQALREEVAKLGGLNDALILAASERLLRNVCKDLRPAAYYAYARLRTDGLRGFADGLELLAALLERYPHSVLPLRAESRKAALEWLNGERFDAFLGAHNSSDEDLQRACAALALIGQRVGDWDAALRPDLQPLLGRFEAMGEAGEHSAAPAAPAANPGDALPAVGRHGEVASSSELLERAREMAVYLRRQNSGYLPAYRLLRCIRWDTVSSPPPADAQGRTRLPPPRPELQQHLRRLALQQQWHELLERVELAFVEGANHFWLDLQCYAWQAQGHSGPEYAISQDILLTDFAQMRDRLAGIERLCFSDGTPFAEDATLEWIARHAVIRDLDAGEPAVVPPPGSSDSDWQTAERQAVELALDKGLEAAFAWVETLPPQPGARQRFRQRLLLAQLAEQHGRSDMALHLLAQLDAEAGHFRLQDWEPALVFDIKERQLRIWRQRAQRKDVDKPALQQRIDALLGALASIDPVRALLLGQASS